MRTKMYWAMSVIAIFALAMTVSGCKNAAEKVAETIVEQSADGDVDVDVDNDQVVINTNAGSFQAGEELSLPSGFPSDVYVVDGTIKAAITTVANESYTVSIESTKSVADVKTAYEQQLASDGWTITTNAAFGGAVTMLAEKDNRTLGVSMSEIDGKTTVSLNTATKDTDDSMQTPDDAY